MTSLLTLRTAHHAAILGNLTRRSDAGDVAATVQLIDVLTTRAARCLMTGNVLLASVYQRMVDELEQVLIAGGVEA